MDTEHVFGVGPYRPWLEATFFRKGLKLRHRIFVGVLCVDLIASLKWKAFATNIDRLRVLAHKMGFNAALVVAVNRTVLESIGIEVTA